MHRRRQEVNTLCTDSGPHRAEYCIVAFQTIQPSSFLYFQLLNLQTNHLTWNVGLSPVRLSVSICVFLQKIRLTMRRQQNLPRNWPKLSEVFATLCHVKLWLTILSQSTRERNLFSFSATTTSMYIMHFWWHHPCRFQEIHVNPCLSIRTCSCVK